MTVSGIEHRPIYVVATDDEARSHDSDDYVAVPPCFGYSTICKRVSTATWCTSSRVAKTGRIKLADLACAERAIPRSTADRRCEMAIGEW